MFLKTSQNSQENTCTRVFFNKVVSLRYCIVLERVFSRAFLPLLQVELNQASKMKLYAKVVKAVSYLLKVLKLNAVKSTILDVYHISSNERPRYLFNVDGLRSSTYWREGLNRWRPVFQSKRRNHSHEISTLSKFLFSNNNKWLSLRCIVLNDPELLVICFFHVVFNLVAINL